MDLQAYDFNLQDWFLSQTPELFPDNLDYVSLYKSLLVKLEPVQKQVTAGADVTDGTSLTWHDQSHIDKVIRQASKMLSYTDAKLTAFEAFVLLVAIQIHDIKNIEGRAGHEARAVMIFSDLGIPDLIDRFSLQYIGYIVECHSGSLTVLGRIDKDKISHLQQTAFTGDKKLRLRFLAAILRLADEYSDDSARAMTHLLKIGKITKGSIIHQHHAAALLDVDITPNTGKVDFDYHIDVNTALTKFPKYIKEKDTYEDVYLLDEIFERTLKSHYETVYCMRFLRPDISINKLHISIEIDGLGFENHLNINYELEEKGYPFSEMTILQLCGEKYLKAKNGSEYWSGENLKNYIEHLQQHA